MIADWSIDGLNCAGLNRDQIKNTLAGGVRAINLTSVRPYADWVATLSQLKAVKDTVAAMEDVALIATSTGEISQAAEDDRVAIILGTQDSGMLEGDPGKLVDLHAAGVRIMQPNYNRPNAFGCGAPQEGPHDTGMTEAGRFWLEEMHRLRMVADLSHCGHRTATDFIAASKGRPIVVSHANSYEVCRSPRNKTDEHIRGIAETGGLIGAVMWSPAVRHDRRPTIDNYLDHVDHMGKVGGVEHVGFASDLVEGPETPPDKWDKTFGPNGTDQNITGILGDWYVYENRTNADFSTMSQVPHIWDAMARRGYSADAREKIMRGNWFRVLSDVWGG